MEMDLKPEELGERLGLEAVERVVALAEQYCESERQRIELSNQPRIRTIEAELAIDADEFNRLDERLRLAAPPGDTRARRREASYRGAVALVLTTASFAFLLLTVDPYRFGWKGWLACAGAVTAVTWGLDKFLECWDRRGLIKVLATIGFAGAIASLAVLAVIRGEVLGQQLQSAETRTIEIDAEDSVSPNTQTQTQNSFYQDTLPLLKIAMALLALGMELGAGLALHDARRLANASGEDYEDLADRRRQVQEHMTTLLYESEARSLAGAIFAAGFWRNFHRAMLTHVQRNGLWKLVLLFLLTPLLGHAQARPTEQLNIVIAVDLSASVASKGHDGRSDFEKNLAAVTSLLAKIPPASRVTVLGITEDSFSRPYILLSARTEDDPGYFEEKIAAARQQLIRVWRERSAKLEPRSSQTDILGAIVVAGQLLGQRADAERKLLVIYSDMLHVTRYLDLETKADISAGSALAKVAQEKLLPNLNGIEVHVLGATASRRDAGQWDRTRQFWTAYFAKAGASLASYSILRDLPLLKP